MACTLLRFKSLVGRKMKPFATSVGLLLALASTWGAEPSTPAKSEADQRDRLFQRFLAEMRKSGIITNMDTNLDTAFVRQLFDQMVVHPSFGLRWDEVPAPTLQGINAMASVEAFVATNG